VYTLFPVQCQEFGYKIFLRLACVRKFIHTGVNFVDLCQREKIEIKHELNHTFMCLSIKTVHLELISDLLSEGFLTALHFEMRTSRAYLFQHISPNETNFVDASNELKELPYSIPKHTVIL